MISNSECVGGCEGRVWGEVVVCGRELFLEGRCYEGSVAMIFVLRAGGCLFWCVLSTGFECLFGS